MAKTQGRHRKVESSAATISEAPASRPRRSARRKPSNPLLAAAGAALVIATATAAAVPSVPTPAPVAATATLEESDAAVQLAASILNIPANILIDLINIPAAEIDAVEYEAAAFLFGGSWWVSMGTNVWGTDLADPPKYIGGARLGLPLPVLGETLGRILSSLAIAEIPVNAACGTTSCTDPGPLISNFFRLPLPSLFNGSFYLDPAAPGQQSFGGYVPTNPFGDEWDLPGTKTVIDPVTGKKTYLQPWAGQNINLTQTIAKGYDDYMAHLMSDPFTENKIRVPDLQKAVRAVTSLIASFIVAFNPFTPGTSYFPGVKWPREITPEGIVSALVKADPGNKLLAAWLGNHAWQQSQGAPGTPIPTPSTEESVEAGKGKDLQPVNPAPIPTPNPFLTDPTIPVTSPTPVFTEPPAPITLPEAPAVADEAPLAALTVVQEETPVEVVTEVADDVETPVAVSDEEATEPAADVVDETAPEAVAEKVVTEKVVTEKVVTEKTDTGTTDTEAGSVAKDTSPSIRIGGKHRAVEDATGGGTTGSGGSTSGTTTKPGGSDAGGSTVGGSATGGSTTGGSTTGGNDGGSESGGKHRAADAA